jgi:hypothetical protein
MMTISQESLDAIAQGHMPRTVEATGKRINIDTRYDRLSLLDEPASAKRRQNGSIMGRRTGGGTSTIVQYGRLE